MGAGAGARLEAGARLGLIAGLTGTGAIGAQQRGCRDRVYSDANLTSRPDQPVRRITVRIRPADDETFTHSLVARAVLAHHGIGGEKVAPGHVHVQGLICFAGSAAGQTGSPDRVVPGWTVCAVKCDGGALQISVRRVDRLDLRTAGFVLEEADEGCGGPARLTPEGHASVLFRLVSATAETCRLE